MRNAEAFIGQDIIELFGNAMYVDPLVIFREYIQNSVDAIDEAVAAGMLNNIKEGRIDIFIDPGKRIIKIRDNGIGISDNQFSSRMLSIGGSIKRYMPARGFRGIGRLAGLGFCQELIFRSKTVGSKVSQLKWDIRKMKSMLAENKTKSDITNLIQQITETETLDEAEFPEHFFEVELKNPLRLGKDLLVNIEKVKNYIEQVAPVPYSPFFKYADDVREFLANNINFSEYSIFINDESTQIFKPYNNIIKYSDTKQGNIKELKFFKLNSLNDGVAAIGWLAHHDYLGAIPVSSNVGGLRTKIGNIQIGQREIFADVFPEARFNSWAIGEVHIFDKHIVPNVRRDNFEHGNHLANIKSQLLPFCHEISRRCRAESLLRNQLKELELRLGQAENIADILYQNAISKTMAKEKTKEAKEKISEVKEKISEVKKPCLFKANIPYQKYSILEDRIKKLDELFSDNKLKNQNDKTLANIPNEDKNTLEKVFDLIYKCSNNPQSAKNLIDHILEQY